MSRRGGGVGASAGLRSCDFWGAPGRIRPLGIRTTLSCLISSYSSLLLFCVSAPRTAPGARLSCSNFGAAAAAFPPSPPTPLSSTVTRAFFFSFSFFVWDSKRRICTRFALCVYCTTGPEPDEPRAGKPHVGLFVFSFKLHEHFFKWNNLFNLSMSLFGIQTWIVWKGKTYPHWTKYFAIFLHHILSIRAQLQGN